tara:strand:+ start:3632 stop:4072 length:441 start_codon:yes stop_codon:yes gene_type:complete
MSDTRQFNMKMNDIWRNFADSLLEADVLRPENPILDQTLTAGGFKTAPEYRQEYYNQRNAQHPSASGEHNHELFAIKLALDRKKQAEQAALIKQIAFSQRRKDRGLSTAEDLTRNYNKDKSSNPNRQPDIGPSMSDLARTLLGGGM